MTTLYGIKNCDTVRKARRWLDEQGVDYRFHDVRTDGLSLAKITAWTTTLDWETLLNRRGMTWRKLPEAVRNSINKTAAIKIMLEHPTIIKRPVLETGNGLMIGFNSADYQTLFNPNAAS